MNYFRILLYAFLTSSSLFECVDSCNVEPKTDFKHKGLHNIDDEAVICFSQDGLKVNYIKTHNGIVKESEILSEVVCSSTANKFCVRMKPYYEYIVVSNADGTQNALVVRKAIFDDMKTDNNQPRYDYFRGEFECFQGVENDLAAFENMETALNGKLFYVSPAKTDYCFVFGHSTESNHRLIVNLRTIDVFARVRSVATNHWFQGLPECKGTEIFDMQPIESNLMVLQKDISKFCINSLQHVLDKIKRTVVNEGEAGKELQNYCKRVKSDGIICLKVGNDFTHATFHTVNADRRMLILQKAYATAKDYDTHPTASKAIDINHIGCGNSELIVDKTLLATGYYDSVTTKKICTISSEIVNSFNYKHGDSSSLTYTFNGCQIGDPRNINNDKIIKFTAADSSKCVPKRFSILETMYHSGFTFEKFVLNEDKICSGRLPKKSCYNLNQESTYAVIANEIDSTKILLYRKDVINDDALQNFVFEDTYYKNEVFCVHISQVLEKNKVLNSKYTVSDTSKICFIIELMTEGETIKVGPIHGCENKIIKVNPTEPRPNGPTKIDQQECSSFLNFESESGSLVKINSRALLKKCLVYTCHTIDYYLNIPTSTANTVSSKIHQCKDQTSCIQETPNDFIIYKIRNPLNSHAKMIKIKENLPTMIPLQAKAIYAATYYKEEFVCFIKNNVDGGTPETTFQIQSENEVCSIINELSEDISVTLKLFEGCKKVIRLRHDTERPASETEDEGKQCEKVINSETSVHKVSSSLLWQCISLTCSVLGFSADLTNPQSDVFFSLHQCNEVDGVNPCQSHFGKPSLVKITGKMFQNYKILHTLDLDTEISESQFYEKYYDAHDIICFPKNKIESTQRDKFKQLHIEGNQRTCVVPQLLSERVQLDLKYSVTCNRQITIENTVKTVEKTAARKMHESCQRFISSVPTEPQIVTENVNDVKQCITDMCLILSIVVKSTVISNCLTQGVQCNVNDDGITYYKLESRHNQKSFYIITGDALRTTLIEMGTNTFYKSEYYISDIVCFQTDKIVDSETTDIKGVVPMSATKTCYVINDLTKTTTNIELSMIGECKKKITLKKETKPSSPPESDTNDKKCNVFINRVEGSNPHLTISAVDLKFCITHLCLKQIFFVPAPKVAGDYQSKIAYCETNLVACTASIDNFDYAKVQNLFTGQTFYVQNNVQREITATLNTFNPSPYYKDEIVCFLSTNLQEDTSDNSNSFILGNYKCIIMGEKPAGSVIKIRNMAGCVQTSTISSKELPIIEHTRDVDHLICSQFIMPSTTHEVHSVSMATLKKCLIHTCSSIVTKVDVPEENKPFSHSKISDCPQSSTKFDCLQDTHVYDFIKVSNRYIGSSSSGKYFRTFEAANIQNYIQKRNVFYSEAYYNDDAVCFYDKSIDSIANNRKQDAGIFFEDSRVCVLLNEQTSELKINYKVTQTCKSEITLNHGQRVSTIAPAENPRITCPDFYSKRTLSGGLPKYTIDNLKSCLTKTCSNVVQFVKLNSEQENYYHKTINVCEAGKKTECLSGATYFDALKISSSFLHGNLYVQSQGSKQSNMPFYKSKYYKDKYFAEDTVCFHDDFIVSSNIPSSSDAIFKNGDVTCYMPSELTEPGTIQIRLYGKCLKSITLINGKAPVTVEPVLDECAPMYTTPSLDPSPMDLLKLRECLVSTCGKIEFYVTDLQNQPKPLKRFHSCVTKYGDPSCMDSETDFFMAAIKVPPFEHTQIYIKSKSISSFTDTDFDEFYYKTNYYQDEVICVNSLKAANTINQLTKLKTDNENYVCIAVGVQGDGKTVALTTKNGCSVTINLHNKVERKNKEVPNDIVCRKFYTEDSGQHSVTILSIQQIKTCITHTCSKVETYFEKQTEGSFAIDQIKKGSQVHGNSGDLLNIVNKVYELIRVSNAYRKTPFFIASHESLPLNISQQIYGFQKSIYTNDENACFPTSSIFNSKEVAKLPGVQSTKSQTCVIGSEVTKDFEIRLISNENCQRIINFVASNQISSHSSKMNDDKCKTTYSGTGNTPNLIVSPREDFLTCTAHTCSKYKTLEIPKRTNICLDQSKNCVTDENYAFALVDSPYKESTFLVMTENVQNTWKELFKTPIHYANFYSANEIACFGNGIITASGEGINKYADTTPTIQCFGFGEKSKEHILIFSSDSEPKLSYFGTEETKVSASPKKLKLEIYGEVPDENTVAQIYNYQTKFDTSKKEIDFTDINDLETCVSESEQQDTLVDLRNISALKYNGLAFTISSNPIFTNKFVFFTEEGNTCVGYFNPETQSKSDIASIGEYGRIPLDEHQCLYIVNGRLSITLNSNYNKKLITPSKDDSCINFERLNQTCKYIYQMTPHITVCYRFRRERSMGSKSNIKSGNPIYLMLKNNDCYHHKVTVWQRVSFCQVKDGDVSISLFDWDYTQQTRSGLGFDLPFKTTSAANIGGGLSIGFAAIIIGFAFMYYLGRQSKRSRVIVD